MHCYMLKKNPTLNAFKPKVLLIVHLKVGKGKIYFFSSILTFGVVFFKDWIEIPEIQHETEKRWHSYQWGAVSCCDCQNPKLQEYALQTWAGDKKCV